MEHCLFLIFLIKHLAINKYMWLYHHFRAFIDGRIEHGMEAPIDKNWCIISKHHSKQNDSHSCGVFTLIVCTSIYYFVFRNKCTSQIFLDNNFTISNINIHVLINSNIADIYGEKSELPIMIIVFFL